MKSKIYLLCEDYGSQDSRIIAAFASEDVAVEYVLMLNDADDDQVNKIIKKLNKKYKQPKYAVEPIETSQVLKNLLENCSSLFATRTFHIDEIDVTL